MLFRPSFVALIFALAALGMPAKRDAAEVEADLNTMNSRSRDLDKAILAFPNTGGTLSQAWNIHKDAAELGEFAQSATADASASEPFDETDSETMIQYIKETFIPTTFKVLDDLVAKKQGLDEVHAGGIALTDLRDLQEDAKAFENAMLAKMPADKQSEAKEPLTMIDDKFDEAIEAFS